MKHLLILAIIATSSQALSKQCELATIKATEVHVQYMNGNSSLKESYNATKKMDKLCKG